MDIDPDVADIKCAQCNVKHVALVSTLEEEWELQTVVCYHCEEKFTRMLKENAKWDLVQDNIRTMRDTIQTFRATLDMFPDTTFPRLDSDLSEYELTSDLESDKVESECEPGVVTASPDHQARSECEDLKRRKVDE